jgi:citrate synthase
MLARVGSRAAVPAFVEAVKARKETMFGFGHRVYKSRDPRANIIRAVADEVFAIAGRDPLIDVAMELERVALADEYFVKRKVGSGWFGGRGGKALQSRALSAFAAI